MLGVLASGGWGARFMRFGPFQFRVWHVVLQDVAGFKAFI